MTNTPICEGDAEFEKILGSWEKSKRSTRFTHQGSRYMMVRDNDKIKFIRIGPESAIDNMYGSHIWGKVQ